MGVETERKFLVVSDAWRQSVVQEFEIWQEVILRDEGKICRIRQKGDTGYLTLKGPKGEDGLSGPEFEWEIPVLEVQDMARTFGTGGGVQKTRYEVAFAEYVWEVDVYHGLNTGLVTAEIEFGGLLNPMASVDIRHVPLPPWVGRDVTSEPAYKNSELEKHPYSTWGVTNIVLEVRVSNASPFAVVEVQPAKVVPAREGALIPERRDLP